jgi:hypothetical protein
MGMGKSSGSSQVQMTPEQQKLLGAQTDFLTGTAYPAYQSTIGGAKDILNQVMPSATNAADIASGASLTSGGAQTGLGLKNLFGGSSALQSLFSPDYKKEQIQASLQPVREAFREDLGSQTSQFGGAGGAGSARHALAQVNLSDLAQNRAQATAAGVSSNIENLRAGAARDLMSSGTSNIAAGNQALTNRVALAGTPQDVYSKYASIIYGTPQASTTPNFAGTQGGTTSGKGMGFKL